MLEIGQAIVAGILLGGVYILFSLGFTLVFGVGRIINFAHGELVMLAMYGSYWAFILGGIDPIISLVIITPIMFLLGLVILQFIIKPVLNAPALNQVFVTIGLMIVLQSVALILWSADFRMLVIPYASKIIFLGPLRVSFTLLLSFIVALFVTFLLVCLLKLTLIGKAMRALCQDRLAASLMGINIHRIYLFTFAIGSVCAGIAGVLLSTFYTIFPTVGLHFIIIAFVVVALGGLGNVTGAIVGGLIVGLIETLSGYLISPAWAPVIYLMIFVIVLILKPAGLFGIVGAEEVGLK